MINIISRNFLYVTVPPPNGHWGKCCTRCTNASMKFFRRSILQSLTMVNSVELREPIKFFTLGVTHKQCSNFRGHLCGVSSLRSESAIVRGLVVGHDPPVLGSAFWGGKRQRTLLSNVNLHMMPSKTFFLGLPVLSDPPGSLVSAYAPRE